MGMINSLVFASTAVLLAVALACGPYDGEPTSALSDTEAQQAAEVRSAVNQLADAMANYADRLVDLYGPVASAGGERIEIEDIPYFLPGDLRSLADETRLQMNDSTDAEVISESYLDGIEFEVVGELLYGLVSQGGFLQSMRSRYGDSLGIEPEAFERAEDLLWSAITEWHRIFSSILGLDFLTPTE